MSIDYDIIVVGAGPGGSNAAAVALGAGLRVAQIERHRFPRVKPCAGALTIKACDALRLDLEPSLRVVATAFEFNVWGSRVNRFSHQTPVLKMVLRPEFDNLLVEQNKRFDTFSFFDGERVMRLDYDGGVFRVETDKGARTCRQLVGADGAYSFVNRVFGISQPKASAVAVEVNLYREAATVEKPLLPCFDFGAVERGYGWVFPKDNHWSVGLYSFAKGVKDFRARLAAYIAAKGFSVAGDALESFEAHKIPVGGYRLRVPDAPVYLVGDAGGFADALTGEGIYHALESGRLAGETLCEVARGRGTHRAYYRRLWKNVLPDTFLTYQFSKKFYGNISKAIRILENPLVWRPFVQGYAEGATFARSLLGGGRFLTKSIIGRQLKHERRRDQATPLEARR
ncbi:MAG TPA: geranylgeranyl reductase family protein [Pyrinomonadaceae bacterium]|jgi:geranylgeranyl reductase family protein